MNTTANDSDPWLADDLRYIVFSRSPANSATRFTGPFQIYEASR